MGLLALPPWWRHQLGTLRAAAALRTAADRRHAAPIQRGAIVMSVADLLAHAAEDIAQARQGLSQSNGPIVLQPGTDLGSFLTFSLSGGETVFAGENVATDYTLTKPVTIIGGVFRGPTVMQAPGIAFHGTRFEGTHKDHTILVLGDNSLVNGCVVQGSSEGQKRGIEANAQHATITNTSIFNIWHQEESQAIACWRRTKDLRISYCPMLEATGMSFIAGGTDCAESEIPEDIIIDHVRMMKPASWMWQPNLTIKNAFELKNAKNVKLIDAWIENVRPGGGQSGFAIQLTVRNQEGNAPWSCIEDVLIQRVYAVNVGSGINFMGTDYTHPSGQMRRVTIADCWMLMYGQGSGRALQFLRGPQDVTIRNSQFLQASNSFMDFSDVGMPCTGLTVETCLFDEGWYGIHGEVASGAAALEAYAPGHLWAGNTVRRGASGVPYTYPEGTILA
jgi:hypothetical protein